MHLQVKRLQQELGDAHAADYNTLKRAYVTLVQHFRALQIEAQACHLPSCETRNAQGVSPGSISRQTLHILHAVGCASHRRNGG